MLMDLATAITPGRGGGPRRRESYSLTTAEGDASRSQKSAAKVAGLATAAFTGKTHRRHISHRCYVEARLPLGSGA
jgi:hypothetical protein